MTIYMYLGPSRPFGLPLTSTMLLRGEPEKVIPALADKLAEYKNFRRLFVPASNVAIARQALKTPGTAIALAYAEIAALARAAKKAEQQAAKKKEK